MKRTLIAALVLGAFNFAAQADQVLGTQYQYDAEGNLTVAIDPRGKTSDFGYDALDRLTKIQRPVPLAGQGRPTIAIEYNGQDEVTKVTDPKPLNTTYTVNGFAQATARSSPDTGGTGATYDESGNLLTRTDARGVVADYKYDLLNRLTRIRYNNIVATTFVYDEAPYGVGHLTSMADIGVNTRWSHDAYGRLTRKDQTQDSKTYTVEYRYDSAGRPGTLKYPSGHEVIHTYDSNGRLQQLVLNGSLLYRIDSYAPFGGPTNTVYGNLQTREQVYDLDGRLKSYTLGTEKRRLTYDDAGRIVNIGPKENPQQQTFVYDNNDRLTQWTSPSQNRGYSYDLTGNRTQATIGASTVIYSTPDTTHRLDTISPPLKQYSYNNTGSITGDGSATYVYGDSGRMTQVIKGGVTTNYILNGIGQRVKKSNSTATTYFVYDEAGQLLGEYDNSGNPIQEYVWANGQPVAILRGTPSAPVVFSVETDQLGAPRMVRDSQRKARWSWDPDPFGVGAPDENPAALGVFTLNLRFPGQYFDKESNLHYNYFRTYDPSTGRYIESDPIGLNGGITTYGYVEGDPINDVDPLGLMGYGSGGGPRKYKPGEGPGTNAGKAIAIGIGGLAIVASRGRLLGTGTKILEECKPTVTGREALLRELERLRQVERELRAQLDNGRAQAAREIAQGRTPNPHGLGREITETIPKEIEKVLEYIREINRML